MCVVGRGEEARKKTRWENMQIVEDLNHHAALCHPSLFTLLIFSTHKTWLVMEIHMVLCFDQPFTPCTCLTEEIKSFSMAYVLIILMALRCTYH